MLFPLLSALVKLSSVRAAPTEPSVLSIPTHDIVRKDLSAHEAHPNFELYSRWLETPQGSYIRRDPKIAFSKNSNIAAIECHSNLATCLFASRLAFADITTSQEELDGLNSALKEQLQARDEEDTAGSSTRSLEKRSGLADTLYSATHLKTYHNLGEDDPVGGFQHYIAWDLKVCTLIVKKETN